MELDYYLWKNKIKNKDFAKRCGIAPPTLSVIVHKKRSPLLLTAIKINAETKGQVSLYELLTEEDRKIIDEKYSFVKKDCIYKMDE